MVRFIHTADIQLGMRAKEATGAGQHLRDARMTTLSNIVTLATEEHVDFVLIAGDLFEDNQVSAMTVSRTVQILQQASPIPVYILPGNHDRLDTGSVYLREAFAPEKAGNITVLREPAPISVGDGCVLYPCPVRERSSFTDPTAWIPARSNASIRIGVAHGGVTTIRQDFDYPIPPTAPSDRELDYLALGDWHGMAIYDGNRMTYPGTPEQTSFGEDIARTGQVLLVSIAQAGVESGIERKAVGTLRWLDWTREVQAPVAECLQAIKDEVTGLDDGVKTLLRLTLTGTLPTDALAAVDELDLWLDARCANGDLLYAEQRVQLRTTEELAGALRKSVEAEPILAAAVANLQRLAAPERTEIDCAGQHPRDLLELLEWWKQTNPPPGLEPGDTAERALALLAEITMEVR